MSESTFRDVIQAICDEDPRYDIEGYLFVCEALQYTSAMLDKPKTGPGSVQKRAANAALGARG